MGFLVKYLQRFEFFMVVLTLLCLARSSGWSTVVLSACSMPFSSMKSSFVDFFPYLMRWSPFLLCHCSALLLPLGSPKLLLTCDSADSFGSLVGVGFLSLLRSSNVSGICGGKTSLSFSLPFSASAFDEATEALAEPFRPVLLSSCNPSSVSLLSFVTEYSYSSLLSDLAEFDLPLCSPRGNTTGDDIIG